MSSFSNKQSNMFSFGVTQFSQQPNSSSSFSQGDSNPYLMSRVRPPVIASDSGLPKDHSHLPSELDSGITPTMFSSQVTPPLILTSASSSDEVSPFFSGASSSAVSPSNIFPSRSFSSPLNQQPQPSRGAVVKPQVTASSYLDPLEPSYQQSVGRHTTTTRSVRSSAPGRTMMFTYPRQSRQQEIPYFDDDFAEAQRKWTEDGSLEEDPMLAYNFAAAVPPQRCSGQPSFKEGYEPDDAVGFPEDYNNGEEQQGNYSVSSPAVVAAPMSYLYGSEEQQATRGRRRSTGGGGTVGRRVSTEGTVQIPAQYCKFFQTGTCTRGDQCKFLHRYAPGVVVRTSSSSQLQRSPEIVPNMTVVVPNTQPARRTPPPSGPYRRDLMPAAYGQSSRSVPAQSTSIPAGLSTSPNVTYKLHAPLWNSEPLYQAPPSSSPSVTSASASFNSSEKSSKSGEAHGHVPLSPPPLSSFIGHFAEMSMDQNGSRYLQHQFDIATDDLAVGVVLSETLSSLSKLSCDPIAGYMCQKMMDKASHKQRLAIIESLRPNSLAVCCNVHGTRTVQKLANRLENDDEIMALRDMIFPWVLELSQNTNGNHVVQKCLHKFKPEVNQYIYDAITNPAAFLTVATHRHGCCVVQRALDYGNPAQCNTIITLVVANALPLVQDAFGNYVTQYVLQMKQPDMPLRFANALRGHVPELSMQKFSSNVIEKIMRSGDESAVEAIIDELIHVKDMKALVLDPFANYVIQTALTVCSDTQHRELAAVILPHQTVIRNTLYGKRIMNKLRRDRERDPKPSQ